MDVDGRRAMDTQLPQRDPDLLDADDYLTGPKLDNLWDWFCAANHEKMDLQTIFVKLVNSARKPYRDSLLHSPTLSMPGTSRNTSSECTVTEKLDAPHARQQPHHRDDTPGAQLVYRTLAIAEDSLQTKQIIINQLQDRIRDMDQEQQEFKKKVEEEKGRLELDLRTEQAKCHALATDLVEQVARADELQDRITDMDQEQKAFKQKVQNEKRQLELDLAAVKEKHDKCLTDKKLMVNQLQDRIRDMDLEQKAFKQKVQGEKRRLKIDLAAVRAEHDKCHDLTPTYVAIRSASSDLWIQMCKDDIQRVQFVGALGVFELLQHSEGLVSFKSAYFDDTYLSFVESSFTLKSYEGIDSTDSTKNKFRLLWSDNAEVKIEPADVEGRFLDHGALFHIIVIDYTSV
ncbi:hypothetical protein BDZ91DRAFT_851395 [Kalaharituber pfeilii]|nr:hypothetical protein BDZ91DRAFT_851395 [Kalaharituber pfeilii]